MPSTTTFARRRRRRLGGAMSPPTTAMTLSMLAFAVLALVLLTATAAAAAADTSTAAADVAAATNADSASSSASTTGDSAVVADGDDIPEFVATDEWQDVLPGQSIPPGLWVRLNMETGVRTARTLPPEERAGGRGGVTGGAGNIRNIVIKDKSPRGESVAAVAVVPDSGVVGTDNDDKQVPPATADEAAAAAAATAATAGSTAVDAADENQKKKFKRYTPEQMKELMEGYDALVAQTDAEDKAAGKARAGMLDVVVMKQMLAVIAAATATETAVVGGGTTVNDTDTATANADAGAVTFGVDDVNGFGSSAVYPARNVTRALSQLEDLAHQYDNAGDLTGPLGALPIVYPLLFVDPNANNNHNPDTADAVADAELLPTCGPACYAAWLLGTAAQNNPIVQRAVIDSDGVAKLLRALHRSVTTMRGEAVAAAGVEELSTEERERLRARSTRVYELQGKLLYALTSVSQNQPQAMEEIARATDMLATVVITDADQSRDGVVVRDVTMDVRVQRKLVKLMSRIWTSWTERKVAAAAGHAATAAAAADAAGADAGRTPPTADSVRLCLKPPCTDGAVDMTADEATATSALNGIVADAAAAAVSGRAAAAIQNKKNVNDATGEEFHDDDMRGFNEALKKLGADGNVDLAAAVTAAHAAAPRNPYETYAKQHGEWGERHGGDAAAAAAAGTKTAAATVTARVADMPRLLRSSQWCAALRRMGALGTQQQQQQQSGVQDTSDARGRAALARDSAALLVALGLGGDGDSVCM